MAASTARTLQTIGALRVTDPVRTDPAGDSPPAPSRPEGGQDEPSLWQQLFAAVATAWRTTSHVLGAVLGPVWRLLCAIGRVIKRWRAPLVLIPLLAGLAYAGYVGADLLWGEPDDVASPGPDVTCWDGAQAPRSACTLPTGAKGLEWVFPSFEAKAKGCSEVTFPGAEADRPVQFDCVRRVSGARATISYSERSSLERRDGFVERRYPGVTPVKDAGGDRMIYRDAAPRGNGRFEVAVTYTDYPYAVTINGASRKVVNRLLRKAVEFRPAAFVTVSPASSTTTPEPDPSK